MKMEINEYIALQNFQMQSFDWEFVLAEAFTHTLFIKRFFYFIYACVMLLI